MRIAASELAQFMSDAVADPAAQNITLHGAYAMLKLGATFISKSDKRNPSGSNSADRKSHIALPLARSMRRPRYRGVLQMKSKTKAFEFTEGDINLTY